MIEVFGLTVGIGQYIGGMVMGVLHFSIRNLKKRHWFPMSKFQG